MTLPKITVATVCRNTANTIEETLQNILSQNYENLEFIVIDGASTDDTLKILEKYKKHFTKFVSEPDKGTYDAMNKAISMATGEWIIFMNAQDRFVSPDSLRTIAQYLTNKHDVVYGGYYFEHVFGVTEYRPPISLEQLWKGMNICHQAVFTRLSFLKEYPYNLDYRIVADYDAILHQYYVQNARFLAAEIPVSILRGGGISDKKRIQSIQQQILVAEKYDHSISHKIWRRFNLLNRMFRVFIRDLVPKSLVKRYLEVTRNTKSASK